MLEKAGTIILLEMWKKSDKKSQERPEFVFTIAYDKMIEENWELASLLFSFILTENNVYAEDKLMSKVNYWQCMKWSGEYEAVREEVESADFSAYDKRFQLSLYALKDDFESLFKILPSVTPTFIKFEELEEWPIFKELRKESKYKEILENAGYQITSTKQQIATTEENTE